MRRKIGFGWLLLGSLLLTAPHLAQAEDTITFGHVGSPSAIVWPLYIGMTQGQFAAETIRIDMIFTRSSAQVLQQLAAGSLDLGDTGAFDPVRGVDQGAAVAILAIEATPGPFSLLAKSSIKSIKDLKGKTISVGETTDIARVYLDRMLEANGMKDADVDALPTNSTAARLAALQSGAVDAAVLSAPASFKAAAEGFVLLGQASDYVKDFPFGTLVISRQWAAANKALVMRFKAAYLKSVAWFYEDKNRAEAIRLMVDASKASEDDVTKSYDYYRQIGFFERTGTVSRAGVESLIDVLKKNGELKTALDADKLMMPGITEAAP
jgi:NitT/TauT family transport system substrate-binding protein